MADQAGVMTWDYRESPNVETLARIVAEVSGGRVHVRSLNTGCDEYGIAVSTVPLDEDAAARVWDRYWSEDEGAVFELETEVPRG